MLRRTLLYLSKNRSLRRWVENSSFSSRLTSRFVAGKSLADGIEALRRLAGEGISASLDFLGENVQSLTEATQSKNSYLAALEQIKQTRLPATVSVKLTQLGLDYSADACRGNVAELVQRAKEIGSRVELDMEGSAYVDRTLNAAIALNSQFGGHVRAVVQAYLYRTEDDIALLSGQGIPVRLCKGAYRESARVAYQRKSDVDANYVKLMKLLLQKGTVPAIATHDARIVRLALAEIAEQKLSPDRFEFQMLYGVRRDLQAKLAGDGFQIRLYVPYGEAWYPYFMRRLAERPANLFFLARNVLRK
jgi:proline dehydrogenase